MIETPSDRWLYVHETGHVLACEHFEIPATASLLFDEDGTLSNGFCYSEVRGDPFQLSCIGWAGILGEHLLGCVDPVRTPIPWSLRDIVQWEMAASFHLNELSEPDRKSIIGYWDTLKTCKFTLRILQNNRDRLDRLARELAEHYRPKRVAKAEAFARAQQEMEEYNRPETAEQRSIASAAHNLERFVSRFPAGHRDRQMYQAALEFLKRGERPPDHLFTAPEISPISSKPSPTSSGVVLNIDFPHCDPLPVNGKAVQQ